MLSATLAPCRYLNVSRKLFEDNFDHLPCQRVEEKDAAEFEQGIP